MISSKSISTFVINKSMPLLLPEITSEINHRNQKRKSLTLPTFSNNYEKNDLPTKMYSSKKNLFDPSKSSPPNNFLNKLHTRMNSFENLSILSVK